MTFFIFDLFPIFTVPRRNYYVIMRPSGTCVGNHPDVSEDEQSERPENSSRRFKRFWASLTTAQKQALRMVYIKNPDSLTKAEIARKLGIRVDTLQERIDYAIKKLKRFFQEFDG